MLLTSKGLALLEGGLLKIGIENAPTCCFMGKDF